MRAAFWKSDPTGAHAAPTASQRWCDIQSRVFPTNSSGIGWRPNKVDQMFPKKNKLYKHLDCRHVLVLTVRNDQIRSTLAPAKELPSLEPSRPRLLPKNSRCLMPGIICDPQRRELFNVVLWHWVSHFKCLQMSYIIPCPCVDLVGSPASSVWTNENWNLNTLSIFPLSTNSWE